MSPAVDYRDVQGVVRFGYKNLRSARYVLLRVKNRAAAQTWLRSVAVTNAEFVQPPPPEALQVAFTASGLEALGVPAAVRSAFSPEFLSGMADANRSRRLGDVGLNAPERWRWGGPAGSPHVLVMFFTRGECDLDGFMRRATGAAFDDGFTVHQSLPTSDQDGVEPFGFADGLSQPEVDWDQKTDPDSRKMDYRNVAALGEFVLGYPTSTGKSRTVLWYPQIRRALGYRTRSTKPGMKDVGRNGTYVVFRQLTQDVRAFWQFVHRATGGDRAAMERLSSAFVGRKPNGEPLVTGAARHADSSKSHEGQVRLNQFTFDDDPRGVVCPVGSHIRRSNPRNADFPGRPTGIAKLLAALGASSKGFRADLVSSIRFHRILRRGREYGSGLSPEDALQPAPPGESERGLQFICLNANIARQFEFLQNSWLMSTTFADLKGETDPIVGSREAAPGCPATSTFTLPRAGAPAERVTGLPQFVTVKGGEYFFLPGIGALRYLASFSG